MSFCPDKPILAGFSRSFAPYPFSTLEGCYDGDVIFLTRLPVNTLYLSLYNSAFATPTCSLINLSHLRDDFYMPFPSRWVRKLAGSANHLVRLEQQRRGDGQAEGLGCLEVDDQLELHRLLHRQVPRVSPLQDLVHIDGGTAVIRWTAQPIEQEGTLLYPPPHVGGHHRQPALGRDIQDPVALRIEQGKRWHEQGLGTRARH